MFESTFPSFSAWLTGPTWRMSTWWPSDNVTSKQRSLLRLLAVAHAERLDLVPLVANHAREHRGVHRYRLGRLARRLSEGTPLVDALEQTPDVLPDDAVLAIRFATQTGTLSAAYRHLSDRQSDATDRVQASLRQSLIYFAGMLLITMLLMTSLVMFIVPVLEEMYIVFDFEQGALGIPWTFHAWVTFCRFVADYAPLWILAAIFAAALVWSPPSRRFFRRGIASHWFGGPARTRSVELLRLLSLAVEAGRPLPAALSTLARYHFDRDARGRLLFARNEVEQGADIWDSLVLARLLSPQESKAIAASSSTASRVWTLRRLADWKHEQRAERIETIVALVHPIVVLLFAAMVLVVATGMFNFLASLIRNLA